MRVSPFLVRQLGKVSNTRAISQIFRGEWYLPCPPALAREAEGQLYVLDAPLLCSPGHLQQPLWLTLVPNSTFLHCAYLLLPLSQRHGRWKFSYHVTKGRRHTEKKPSEMLWLPSWSCAGGANTGVHAVNPTGQGLGPCQHVWKPLDSCGYLN